MTEHISIADYLRLIKKGKQGGRQVAEIVNRSQKYNAKPIRDDTGKQVYASKKEGKRALELLQMERAGLIFNLKEQPRFPFKANRKRGMSYPLVYKSGRVVTYVADFEYTDEFGERIIEDVKGMRTPVYKIKQAAMWAYYGLEISEI